MYIRAEQKLWNFKLVQPKLVRTLNENKETSLFAIFFITVW